MPRRPRCPAPRYRPRLELLESRLVPVSSLQISPSPTVNHSFLNATAAIASNDIWAVGEFTNPTTNLFQPLTEHFDGTSWSVVPTPSSTQGQTLNGVTALRTGEVVAVGTSNLILPSLSAVRVAVC